MHALLHVSIKLKTEFEVLHQFPTYDGVPKFKNGSCDPNHAHYGIVQD